MIKDDLLKLSSCAFHIRSNPEFINNIGITTMLHDILSEVDVEDLDDLTARLLFGARGIEELSLKLQQGDLEYGRDWIDYAILHLKTNLSVSTILCYFEMDLREHYLYTQVDSFKYVLPSNVYYTNLVYEFPSKGGHHKDKVINITCGSNFSECVILFDMYNADSGSIEKALEYLLKSDLEFKLRPKNKEKYGEFIKEFSEKYKLMRLLGAGKDLAISQLEGILLGDIPLNRYIYFEDLSTGYYTFLDYKDLRDLVGSKLSGSNARKVLDLYVYQYIYSEYVPFVENSSSSLLTWSYYISLRFSTNVSYFFTGNNSMVVSLITDSSEDRGFQCISLPDKTEVTRLNSLNDVNSFAFSASLKINNL